MPQIWMYWVVFLLQDGEGSVAHHGRVVVLDAPLNSLEAINAMVKQVTADYIEGEPPKDYQAIVPLTWTLVTAKRGSGVPTTLKGKDNSH